MEKAQKAWKEFEAVLLALEGKIDDKNLQIIEIAYKTGYNRGYEDAQNGQAVTFEPVVKVRKAPVVVKRYNPEDHARMVEAVLAEKGKPLRPIEIAAAIKKKFGVVWNPKSYTGHLRTAMRYNKRIIKIGVGTYALKDFVEQAQLDI